MDESVAKHRYGAMGAYLQAREELSIAIMKVMADNKLDAIVHKTVEHQPTFIKDGINPPYSKSKRRAIPQHVPGLRGLVNRALRIHFDNLPVGITFFGKAYSESTLLRLAYAYEQATHHRVPPKTTPPLPGRSDPAKKSSASINTP